MPRVNQDYIAKYLQISQATVSRALHGGPVSEEIRRKVAAACEQFGYHLHHTAHSLASGRTGNIIYAVQDFKDLSGENTHQHLIAAGEAALAHGYKVSIDLVRRVQDLAASQFMDGALVAMHSPSNYAEFIDWVRRTDFPVVLVDVPIDEPGIANVRVDDYRAGYDLTSYLLSLGHRELVFFGLVETSAICCARYEGFMAATSEYGGTRTACVPIKRWVDRPDNIATMQDAIAGLPFTPTAYVASSDGCAVGLIRLLQSLGLLVPRDASVAGFNDSRWSGVVKPALTTMNLQSAKIGQVAMETLLRMMQGNARRRARRITASLVVRQSCAAPRTR